MGILDKAPEESWEHATWMKLLYVIEPEHVTIYAAPEVKCTGQNSEMKGKFPFSWILFENIEKILKSCSENIIGNDHFKFAFQVVKNSEIFLTFTIYLYFSSFDIQ